MLEHLETLKTQPLDSSAWLEFQAALRAAQQRQDSFSALLEVTRQVAMVASVADLGELTRQMLRHGLNLMGGERGALVLLEDDYLRAAATYEIEDDGIDSLSGLSGSVIKAVTNQGKAVLIGSEAEGAQFSDLQPLSIRSVVAVPLLSSEKVLGALYLDSQRDVRVFDNSDLELLTAFSGLTASALELVQLIEARQELFTDAVWSLVRAVEAKDAYTAGHSSRVGLYSRGIAQVLGLSESESERALFAGYLHDVGKIGISDAHVHKPDKLTPEEWAEFKQHPVIGERILGHTEALEPLLPAVRWHHERLDGRGYPDGIKGDQIPLLARIVAVADSFDAMTTDRPYRPSPGKAFALGELSKDKDTHFDAEMVEGLSKALEKNRVAYLGKGE